MKNKIYLNNDWQFSPEFDEKMISRKFRGKMETVRIPHTVAELPYNNFDEKLYQKISVYRKTFKTENAWKDKTVLLTVDAAAHYAEVYLNEKLLATHSCGYTSFTVDLTSALVKTDSENLLVIKVDSRESLDVPPFGNVIDYMTYGGIYRDVYLEIKNPVYIKDVFVKTKSNHFETKITLNTQDIPENYSIFQKVESISSLNGEPSAQIETGVNGIETLTAADAVPVVAWTLENPVLYNLVTELKNEKGKVVDFNVVRFGFRDIRFDESGFYLNNKKIKLRGLNRHQSYPYVGYAMPKNMQIDDADILKKQLGLNYVRTSHYPQSRHFINRCDEIGLLVFTEIPGWQHIGGEKWQNQAVENVREMIDQYKNHPSIFMWGVRINESLDNDELYLKTNELARKMDPTRPTAGVRYLKHSSFLEDVYTFNDFSHTGNNDGALHKNKVTESHGGYLISEYNGHMYPTKSFDDEKHRTNHALRHAKVLDTVASYDEIGGSSGWCAFDYNTHKDFGSGDRICYHGVMDMFRNSKLAAYVYQSQGDAKITGDVLELNSSIDLGEYPAGRRGDLWLFTNADSVKLYAGDVFIKEYTKDDSPYKFLPHGPVLIDDTIGSRLETEDKIKPKYSKSVKEILDAVRIYGPENLPLKHRILFAKLKLLGVVNKEKIALLYSKYLGSWGGQGGNLYRFDAYRNGKLVKSLYKTCAEKVSVFAECNRTELVEDESYDVTEVHLYAKDEYGNVQPYCQEAVTLKTEGPVKIIGPEAVSLKGGMSGVYVKTLGKAGKASLIIKDWKNEEVRVNFSIKIKKV
ncbi:MAG: glycoside hydrolase family 2 TIM barrel-domain containing protein [Spirochaetales bacterium]|nr:glycoside hydrolase family 2 TIM barrel-domain containing protein [Spirochaetales bacterium]